MAFELYTDAGEALAAQRLDAIVADVLANKLTRVDAIARTRAAIAEITAIDDGMHDSEPRFAMARRLNPAFRQVGYVEIDGYDL